MDLVRPENEENRALPFWKQILLSIQWHLRPISVLIFLIKICLSVQVGVFLAMLFDEYQERTVGCPLPDSTWQGWLKRILLELRDHLMDYCDRKKRSIFTPKHIPHNDPWGLYAWPFP
ncbi:uncharacterized protein LOC108046945 [Drosophila rhopaloa]|uniref:Uncharacterized protein LOC108046945 n=1 Tax=Drosophila rhopaloa TaxID=1041015 RepID=A0A6P4FAG1_DRORH|nr:uncharacterized protein LOC108046945 [Drosophila rhopaloa]